MRQWNEFRSTRVALASAGIAALLGACSSGSSPGGNGSCVSTNDLDVIFSPMYSAYDGVHTFQIPAVVDGVNQSAVAWSVSDPTVASVATDPITGGAMITVLNSGSVTVTANLSGACGTSTLTIDSATADQWDAGYQRYHDGIPPETDAGGRGFNFNPQAQCIACHNPDATPTPGSPFTAVSHTPEQAGGFSDSDLIGIFTMGIVPDGGYFDDSIIPYNAWHNFHQWSMTTAEQQGIIVYLRSLTPAPQNGSANFGGHGGGFYDGGHGNYDGGGPGGPGDGG
jgi:hypothetical protein